MFGVFLALLVCLLCLILLAQDLDDPERRESPWLWAGWAPYLVLLPTLWFGARLSEHQAAVARSA